MQHGVLFEVNGIKKHSTTDFGMYLSPFDIPCQTLKTNYVNIDGADGQIDLTEVFGLVYQDLKFNIDFIVTNGNYDERLRTIKAFLHGKIAKITTYKDPNFYYLGRCQISKFKCDKSIGQITISVVAKPYKFKQNKTIVDLSVTKELKHVFKNESMKTVPIFKASAQMQLKFKNGTYSIGTSETRIADIVFDYGDNEIIFVGDGTVNITYQEGAL